MARFVHYNGLYMHGEAFYTKAAIGYDSLKIRFLKNKKCIPKCNVKFSMCKVLLLSIFIGAITKSCV